MFRNASRFLKSALSVVLSAVLILLSPGLECAAASNAVAHSQAGAPIQVIGPMAQQPGALPESAIVPLPAPLAPLSDEGGVVKEEPVFADGYRPPVVSQEASSPGRDGRPLSSVDQRPGLLPALAPQKSFFWAMRRAAARIQAGLHNPFNDKSAENAAATLVLDAGWKDMPLVPAEAPDSIKDISLDVPPGAEFTPSPKEWSGPVYSAFVDRTARAGSYRTWGDPAAPGTRHGGNFRGLIEKLDYFKEAGFKTIMINPVVMNPPKAYHNYWPVHMLAVDPNLGAMADFEELVAEAHKRDMHVILDIVLNHIGPVIIYKEGAQFSMERKTVDHLQHPIGPVELAAPENFNMQGIGYDSDDPRQETTADLLGGGNHIDTGNHATQVLLRTIAKFWMKKDVDGLRIDSYRNINPAFWEGFFPDIRDYAKKLGKDNFLLLGEFLSGDPAALEPELGHGRLNAIFNYPGYFRDNIPLHGEAPASALESSLTDLYQVFGDRVHQLGRFLDNHDQPRFLRPGDPVGLLWTALAYTLFSVGIPFVYYGTEQALRRYEGPAAPGANADDYYRGDMFDDGKFKPAASSAQEKELTYQFVQKLNAVRQAHPALGLGEEKVVWADRRGPGIFAFTRTYNGEEIVVVLNTSGEERAAEMDVNDSLSPVGTEFSDELDPSYQAVAHSPVAPGGYSPSRLTLSIPPHGVRVLVRKK